MRAHFLRVKYPFLEALYIFFSVKYKFWNIANWQKDRNVCFDFAKIINVFSREKIRNPNFDFDFGINWWISIMHSLNLSINFAIFHNCDLTEKICKLLLEIDIFLMKIELSFCKIKTNWKKLTEKSSNSRLKYFS